MAESDSFSPFFSHCPERVDEGEGEILFTTTYSYKWASVESCNFTVRVLALRVQYSYSYSYTYGVHPMLPTAHTHTHTSTFMIPSKVECYESQGLDGVLLDGWLAAVFRP